MDQAPAALALLGDPLEEIRTECRELKGLREECDELKESNGKLLEKVEALENVNRKTQATITSLVTAVSRQTGAAHAQKVNLAAVQHEMTAVRLLLEAQGRKLTDIDDVEETVCNGKPPQQHDVDATMLDEEPIQRKDSVASTSDDQIIDSTEKQSITLPHSNPLFVTPNRPSVIHEMSVESSMTFCAAEKSVQRAKGLINRHIPIHLGYQRSTPTPEASATLGSGPHKKRKTTSSQSQPAPAEGGATFAVPTLPHRLAQSTASAAVTKQSDLEAADTYPSNGLTAAEADQSMAPAARAQLCGARSIRNGPKCRILGARASQSKTPTTRSQSSYKREETECVQEDDDVDMEDKIVVAATKHTRTIVPSENAAPTPATSTALSISHFKRTADQLLRDIDVDIVTEGGPSQSSQPLPYGDGQGAVVEAGSEQPRKAKYTAEQRSWLFEYVRHASGGIPMMPYADMTRQFNQKFDEQRTEPGITALVGKLRAEYHTNNGNQKNGGRQTGVNKKLEAEAPSAAAFESQAQDTPSPGIVTLDKSQLRSVTRVGLLSQFKARTGEMQKSGESQSPEVLDGAGK